MGRGPATKLTAKQQAFVDEYLVDLNATQAAIRAGFSEKAATKIASELLTKPLVRTAIDAAKVARAERVQVTSDEVLRELKHFAFADLGEAFDENGALKAIKDMPPGVRRAIASIETDELFEGHGEDRVHVGVTRKVKFWPKDKGLELLGKHLKMFTDKVEHSGSVSIGVVDPYAKPEGK